MSLTSGMFNPMSRIGFHKHFLQEKFPDFADKEKAVCYVPTRYEVHNMPIEELEGILVNWYQNAPELLVASNDQKKIVMSLLLARRDRKVISAYIDNIKAVA